MVTGASGFIGTALCSALAEAGHHAVSVDARRVDSGLQLDQGDAAVHLAGVAHRKAQPAELRAANVLLSEKIGHAAAKAGIKLLFVSTVKVHGDESRTPFFEASPLAPEDEYASSKVEAEGRLRAIPGLKLTVLRPPLVYGPGVKANFLGLLGAVARGWPLPLASIVNRRSLIYVGNLADAIVRCLESARTAGRTYLLSDGAPVSTPQLCRALGQALGRPARLVPFPVFGLELIPGMKKLTRSLEVDDSALRGDLEWRPPFSLGQGLASTARWYHSR